MNRSYASAATAKVTAELYAPPSRALDATARTPPSPVVSFLVERIEDLADELGARGATFQPLPEAARFAGERDGAVASVGDAEPPAAVDHDLLPGDVFRGRGREEEG